MKNVPVCIHCWTYRYPIIMYDACFLAEHQIEYVFIPAYFTSVVVDAETR